MRKLLSKVGYVLIVLIVLCYVLIGLGCLYRVFTPPFYFFHIDFDGFRCAAYRYRLENGEVTIIGYRGTDPDITIPDRIMGRPVVVIELYAFSGCKTLRAVTIPDSVSEISSCAFYKCKNLEKVTSGRGIQAIDERSFSQCPKLTYNQYEGSYYLGNEENPYFVMMGVESEDSEILTIHPDAAIIAADALAGCNDLKSIVVSAESPHFKSMGNVLLSHDGTLLYKYTCGSAATAYCIPDSVITIKSDAFAHAKNLAEITIPDSVKAIDRSAFIHCEGLTSLTLGNGLETIGEWAFGGCTSLSHITIPDSTTDISDEVFEDCTALETVVIGKNVTNIGCYTFRDCIALREVVFLSPEGWYTKELLGHGAAIQQIDTADPARNAANLTGEYCYFSWHK